MGEIVLPNSPMRFSDYDSSEVQFYPEVGVNNDDVYTNWLALSAEEIESLRQDHVI
jgi:crotonobetainyl-CoA:carnitine CoA-transferase CaiB-like acyl-CoA transferase